MISRLPPNLLPHDGDARFFPNFFSPAEAEKYFSVLREVVAWKQDPIKIFGKSVLQPRLTAWYGEDTDYGYSGIRLVPLPWTPALLAIKARIEAVAKVDFTNALLNLYRDGRDSMGWHRDDEKELGVNPVIGSVSFGDARKFHFRHRENKNEKISLELGGGSFLLMRGSTQHHWDHAIPKTRAAKGARINLTFRVLPRS